MGCDLLGAGMKQLGLSLVGAIKNFEQARRTKQQADAETLERLAKRAGMTPQDAARLAMNRAAAQARNGAVYHATACTKTPLSSAGSRSTPSAR